MNKLPLFHLVCAEHGKFIDYGTGNTKIWNYNTENGEGKVSKYSAYFNGDDEHFLQCDIGDIGRTFTWAMWVYKSAHTLTSYPIFASFHLPYLACDGSTSPFRFSYKNTSSAQVSISGTTIPALNTWYHVAVTSSDTAIRLYVNGVQQASTTTLMISSGPDAHDFELGRHRDTNTYKMAGRLDDVRFYTEELTASEIAQIANPLSDPNKMSFSRDGSPICYNIEEDIEWTLLDNFQSANLDGGRTAYNTAIGGSNITSAAALTSAGWTVYMDAYDSTAYTRVKGYLQMFYSSSPIGYIYKNLPTGYNKVKVYWGNWYSGTATLKIGGVAVQTLGASAGASVYVGDYTGTPEIRFEEDGIVWVSQIWVGKTKTPSSAVTNTIIQKHSFVHNYLSPNLHSYDSWTVSSGSIGSFSQNGATAENVRKQLADPWGQPTIVWESKTDATSDADGGWNHTAVAIDRTKRYRYSVWFKRNNNTNGRFYHGCNGYGTTDGVYGRSDGALNTNPYFLHYVSEIPAGVWYLIVAHIWPAGSGTGSNYSDSGVYNIKGDKVYSITQDYVWHTSSTTGRGRTYLYYGTDTNQIQWMVYPVFEKCDGTESSLIDLISGKAYCNSGKIPSSNLNISPASVRIQNDKKLLINNKIILK